MACVSDGTLCSVVTLCKCAAMPESAVDINDLRHCNKGTLGRRASRNHRSHCTFAAFCASAKPLRLFSICASQSSKPPLAEFPGLGAADGGGNEGHETRAGSERGRAVVEVLSATPGPEISPEPAGLFAWSSVTRKPNCCLMSLQASTARNASSRDPTCTQASVSDSSVIVRTSNSASAFFTASMRDDELPGSLHLMSTFAASELCLAFAATAATSACFEASSASFARMRAAKSICACFFRESSAAAAWVFAT
mmetsp:Transcript_6475/g.16025  ORF Transcript_6475/g.16025 Transcript_6475/m.16025 type:complete len:253 (+) Transcript_6475:22-780(+)